MAVSVLPKSMHSVGQPPSQSSRLRWCSAGSSSTLTFASQAALSPAIEVFVGAVPCGALSRSPAIDHGIGTPPGQAQVWTTREGALLTIRGRMFEWPLRNPRTTDSLRIIVGVGAKGGTRARIETLVPPASTPDKR